jgi:DNA polymerase I-like protein with 3'-5' exonuclease and polymerase domains
MQTKRILHIPFKCGSIYCPKHLDEYNPYKFRQVNPPIKDNFRKKGCHEFASSVWVLFDEFLSDDEVAATPLIGAILPCPDPTGAQAIGGGYGVSKDIIFEQLYRAHGNKPLRVALFYLTRGYNFNKALRSELAASPIPKPAISYCAPYLTNEILKVNPSKILLCGQEVLNNFFVTNPELPVFRREYQHTITVGGQTFPVQGTFNPHLAAIAPVYIKSIYEDCRKLFEPPRVSAPTSCRLITDFDEALEYIDFLQDYPGYISFDTETQNLLRKGQNKLATLQFATNHSKGVVIPYQHWQSPFSPDELAILKKRFTILFGKKIASKGWISHGAKFENSMCDMHFGTMLESADIYCTQAMAFLLDETRSERKADKPRDGGYYTLKQLAWDLLNFTGYDKAILKIRGEGALFDLPLTELADYGAMDAVVGHRLHPRILELAAEEDYADTLLRFTRLFYGPITKLVAHIERTGFKTDLRTLRQLSGRRGPFDVRINTLIEQLRVLPGFVKANQLLVKDKSAGGLVGVMGDTPWVLDFNKVDHQALVFYKVLDLEPVSFSAKGGRPAIDDEFFEAYSEEVKEVELFQKYNETKNMRDTFINKMMERVDPETGDEDCKLDQRIRPDIHYARLVTGRLAMVNPNLGQIPKAAEDHDPSELDVRKAVKDCFTVDRDCALLQVDYKVNEVRWAAILAQDTAMAGIFIEAAARIVSARLSGDPEKIKEALFLEDIHRNTAAAAFNVPITSVTKKQRQAAKAITFGILFQQSAKALAEGIGVSEEEALEFQKTFFKKMTGVENLILDLKNQAKTRGFVEAPHGRRRRFWSFYLPKDYYYRRNHENRNLRQAVNSPIQGVASDGAMYGGACSLREYIKREKRSWLIQNVVHDSCLVQTPMKESSEAIQMMESIFVDQAMRKMEEMGVKFNLPLGIDVDGGGIKWGSLVKWDGTPLHADKLQEDVIKMWGDL